MKASASMKALAGMLGFFFLASFATFVLAHTITVNYAASHCDAGSGVALCDAFGTTLASFAGAVASAVPQLLALVFLALAAVASAFPAIRRRLRFSPAILGPAPPRGRAASAFLHTYQQLFSLGILNTKAY